MCLGKTAYLTTNASYIQLFADCDNTVLYLNTVESKCTHLQKNTTGRGSHLGKLTNQPLDPEHELMTSKTQTIRYNIQ